MKKINNLLQKFLNAETIKYLIFGVLTTIVSLVSYKICLMWGMDVVAANTVSTILAVLFAYITNKIWVFESANFNPVYVIKEMLRFFAGRFFTYVVDTAMIVFLVKLVMVDPMISKLITQVIVVVLNYLVSKKAVFNK